MIAFVAMLAVQVLLVVDVIRNGRNQLWIMALIFLPMASTIAYLVVEVVPRFRNHRHVRTARAQIGARIDPERDLRGAREQFDIATTPANMIRLADALTDLGRHKEALPFYRDSIGRIRPDLRTGEKLARSLFQNDQPADALDMLDTMQQPSSSGDRDRIAMLRARLFEELGRKPEAEAIYADIVTRMAGDEARCRYAALLLADGRVAAARSLLEEVDQRRKRLTRQQIDPDAVMYDWASRELGKLRQG